MNISRQRYKEIKSIVNTFSKLFDTTDPFKICKLLGIEISCVPLSPNISGFVDVKKLKAESLDPKKPSLYIPNATIFLSTYLDCHSQKIVCAHELGHILLQGNEQLNFFDVDDSDNSLSEYEANLFTIELMPHIYQSTKNYLSLSCSELFEYMKEKISYIYDDFYLPEKNLFTEDDLHYFRAINDLE